MANDTRTPADTPADPQAEARLKHLSEELRCLVCQNQTLADSHAELAIDLRNEVKGMISAGRSDTEIKTWLVDRYGDFVLYKPPVQSNTFLLWGGPFLLLALGIVLWMLVQRRSRAARAGASTNAGTSTASSTATSTESTERGRKLLED